MSSCCRWSPTWCRNRSRAPWSPSPPTASRSSATTRRPATTSTGKQRLSTAAGGHPQGTGIYHYHSEPYALSYDDGNFIGVMRDGYAIYGRKDADGTYPTVDMYGGHTG